MFRSFPKKKTDDLSQITLTDEFRSTLSLFENSNDNFFLTGNAGTGKTTLLKQFREQTKKKVVLLAPTGIAAFNLGGQTIHSFFCFPPRIIAPRVISDIHTNNRIYKAIDTIVIDEISMVRADVFEGIDIFMRQYGRDSNRPFGGAQVILAGDPYQLPPVVTSAEEPIISKFYKTPYFFSAKVYDHANFQSLDLIEIHRQHDEKFIKLLNLIRHANVNVQDLKPINDNLVELHTMGYENRGVTLSTTNRVADTINQTHLLKLSVRQIAETMKTKGLVENKVPARKGGRIAKNARKELEKKTGKRIVSGKNFLIAKRTNKKLIKSKN